MISCLQIGAIFLASGPLLARADPDYSAFTVTSLIPFKPLANGAIAWSETPEVKVNVKLGNIWAGPFWPDVDTGSTGFLISAKDLPGWTRADADAHPVGWQFFTSSNNLYYGHWIPAEIDFVEAGSKVIVKVDVLAVEQRTMDCKSHDPTIHQGVCPDKLPEPMPIGVGLMGIGFGRQSIDQPWATYAKNPVLNVDSIAGVSTVGARNYRPGYILTKAGITVGLTNSNMGPYAQKHIPLSHPSGSGPIAPGMPPPDPRDFLPCPGCVAVDGGDCKLGNSLIDTGIKEAYIHLQPASYPISTTTLDGKPHLVDTSTVMWQFEKSMGRIVASETFRLDNAPGKASGIVPEYAAAWHSNTTPVSFNTGRRMLRRWNIAFDAYAGSLAFSPVP